MYGTFKAVFDNRFDTANITKRPSLKMLISITLLKLVDVHPPHGKHPLLLPSTSVVFLSGILSWFRSFDCSFNALGGRGSGRKSMARKKINTTIPPRTRKEFFHPKWLINLHNIKPIKWLSRVLIWKRKYKLLIKSIWILI